MGSGTGVFRLDSGEATISTSTSHLPEGSNLYFTDSGAQTANVAGLSTKEPNITAGTTLQYWRGDKSFQTLNTSVVPEGSNLYYTDARARASISANSPITYSSGVIDCQAASGSQAGCLSSANWTTFNNKMSPITVTASTPSRSLNSNFTPSSTNAVYACYTISIGCSISLAGSCSGDVELRSDTNSTPTTVRSKTSMALGGTLVIGLTLTNTQEVPVCYLVPPNHNVRLVSSGTATISISQQSEVSWNVN